VILHAINVVRASFHQAKKNRTRSPLWAALERTFIQTHKGGCASCGSTHRLQVHHKKPFHLFPELELEPSNLIVLCMDIDDCHLKLGHGGSFKAYNPRIEEHAHQTHSGSKPRPIVEHEALMCRVFAEEKKR